MEATDGIIRSQMRVHVFVVSWTTALCWIGLTVMLYCAISGNHGPLLPATVMVAIFGACVSSFLVGAWWARG